MKERLGQKKGKEVDFVLTENGVPKQMIEAKYSEHHLDNNLKYFFERYKIPAVQIVKNLHQSRMVGGIFIVSAESFLSDL